MPLLIIPTLGLTFKFDSIEYAEDFADELPFNLEFRIKRGVETVFHYNPPEREWWIDDQKVVCRGDYVMNLRHRGKFIPELREQGIECNRILTDLEYEPLPYWYDPKIHVNGLHR